jgi:hypothetical protein
MEPLAGFQPIHLGSMAHSAGVAARVRNKKNSSKVILRGGSKVGL